MMDPIKLNGVIDWPAPKKLKELRGFTGYANFYRRFIENFSELARLLNNLTKKDVPWKWEREQQEAFDALKKRFSTALVLKMPNPENLFHETGTTEIYTTG